MTDHALILVKQYHGQEPEIIGVYSSEKKLKQAKVLLRKGFPNCKIYSLARDVDRDPIEWKPL